VSLGNEVAFQVSKNIRNKSFKIKQSLKKVRIALVAGIALSAPALLAQTETPEWCRALPRPEYRNLQRIPANDPWFEVYKVAPAVFAIYEPHQSEEVISYLIVGDKRAIASSDLHNLVYRTDYRIIPAVTANSAGGLDWRN
jgi:hypothetical protein